jgi:hypothetical protein
LRLRTAELHPRPDLTAELVEYAVEGCCVHGVFFTSGRWAEQDALAEFLNRLGSGEPACCYVPLTV